MPWEKKFDEEKVLNEAMKAFWQNGYDGTSMKHLIKCMGLNPGSIYSTFGDKKALFGRAMTCYTEQIREKHCAMRQNNSPRGFLMAVFDEMISAIQSTSQHDGCFMVNTALDIAPQDKTIQSFISQWFEELQEFFKRTIVDAQKLGEIRANLDPQKTARHIITLICGTQVLARINTDHIAVEGFREEIEAILS